MTSCCINHSQLSIFLLAEFAQLRGEIDANLCAIDTRIVWPPASSLTDWTEWTECSGEIAVDPYSEAAEWHTGFYTVNTKK